VSSYTGAFVCMSMALGGLLALLAFAWVKNIRARRAAREAAKRDRLDAIARMGFRSAFMRGLIDERGNVMPRVGHPDDVQ
jgi:hypothetical protein